MRVHCHIALSVFVLKLYRHFQVLLAGAEQPNLLPFTLSFTFYTFDSLEGTADLSAVYFTVWRNLLCERKDNEESGVFL